jgi:transcription termination/antitermination protein NusA
VYRNVDAADDDVELTEFSDEIEGWIIDELKSIGCDTARDVLKLDAADLVKRTDLEEETVIEVLKVLQSELE